MGEEGGREATVLAVGLDYLYPRWGLWRGKGDGF